MLASNSWSLMFRMTIDTMSSVASTQVRAMYQSSTNNDDRIFISAFHTGSQRQVRHGFARLGGGGDVNAAMTETADDRWYWLTRNISEFNSGAQFVSSPWTRNRPADWTYAGWATAKDTNVWFRITFEVPNTSALDVSICDIYLTDIPLL
jgi:hypothetical protein